MGVLDKARMARGRVVFPEADDARIRKAAAILADRGRITPVFLDVARPASEYIEFLLARRPGLKPALALRMLEKPLFRAAAMVAAGEADAMVAGAVSPTRRVIEAAAMVIGLSKGVSVPSSFFVMVWPDGRTLVLADCALNVAPDAQGLAAIARASARSAEALLGHAEVALLSFSTGRSGSGASVETVRAACEILEKDGISVRGPVQADAALNSEIAARKGMTSDVANVLIFPSLDAGNIAYKLLQELAGAQAIGPVLQGFQRPVCDLSRGARINDIVAASEIALSLA